MRIRAAKPSDLAFVLDLTPRLTEFGPVPGRDTPQMVSRDRAVLTDVVEHPTAMSGVFIAEDDDGRSVGFIHLTTDDDYYTDSKAAHIADVVVLPEASRSGIGTALMVFAEQWARDRRFRLMTLNVFAGNHGPRSLYAKLGYREEWIRCVKDLT